MTTNEMRKRLREMGRSESGPRNVFKRRLSDCSQEDGSKEGDGEVHSHASDKPLIVMVDESSGDKYMRALDHDGVGEEGDNIWLIKGMHQELKSWGHPGGVQNV